MPDRPSTTPSTSRARFLLSWAGALACMYVACAALTRLATWAIFVKLGVEPRALPMEQVPLYAAGFFLFFSPILYALPCALAGQWLKPDARSLMLYAGTAFFFGAGAELIMNPLFMRVLERPCYLYSVWPIHHGATSGFGLIMWPMYGAFVCVLHQAVHTAPRLAFLDNDASRAAMLAVDAMMLEVAANLYSLLGFGTWLFRYHAPDLEHFTTAEAFPIYLVGGGIGLRLLVAMEAHPRRAQLGAVLFVAIVALAFGLDGRV